MRMLWQAALRAKTPSWHRFLGMSHLRHLASFSQCIDAYLACSEKNHQAASVGEDVQRLLFSHLAEILDRSNDDYADNDVHNAVYLRHFLAPIAFMPFMNGTRTEGTFSVPSFCW